MKRGFTLVELLAVIIILGVLIILHPKAIASIIPFVLGLIIIINSSTKLNYAFQLKSQANQLWKSTLVVSIFTTLCGLLLMFSPFTGAVLLTRIVGVIILVYALLDIISSLIIRKNVIKIQKALDEPTTNEAEVVEEKDKEE